MLRNLDRYFETALESRIEDPLLRSYIVGTFVDQAFGHNVHDHSMIVNELLEARTRFDFAKCQSIGDWSLWFGTFMPEAFNVRSTTYEHVARSAYVTCNTIMQGSWNVFKVLSQDFSSILSKTRDVNWSVIDVTDALRLESGSR